MKTYRVSIDRAVRFQIDLEANSRMDALWKVVGTAMVYDDQDLKETRVISVQELEQVDVQHPPD